MYGHGDLSLDPSRSSNRGWPPALHNAALSFIWVTQRKEIVFCGGIKDGETDPTAECNTYQIGHGWPQAGPTTPLPHPFYGGAHADLGNGRHWIGGGSTGSISATEHVLVNGLTRKILNPPLSQGLSHACAARLPDYKVFMNELEGS